MLGLEARRDEGGGAHHAVRRIRLEARRGGEGVAA